MVSVYMDSKVPSALYQIILRRGSRALVVKNMLYLDDKAKYEPFHAKTTVRPVALCTW